MTPLIANKSFDAFLLSKNCSYKKDVITLKTVYIIVNIPLLPYIKSKTIPTIKDIKAVLYTPFFIASIIRYITMMLGLIPNIEKLLITAICKDNIKINIKIFTETFIAFFIFITPFIQ